jgi:AcrR family transcriptional regulator
LDAFSDEGGEGAVVSLFGPREAIMSAAADLFDKVGYHNASLASIAEQAGTTKAAVLEIFRVKHDILYAIHDAWIDDLLEMARQHLRPDHPVCDAIRICFRDVLALVSSRPNQVRIYFQYYRDLPPDLQKMAKAKRDMYEAQVEGLIRRGIETGVFRTQNARVATLGLFGMCNWTYQWFRPDSPSSSEQVADQLSDIYLRGLCADPGEAGEH